MLPPVLWLCGDSHIITRVALCVILFLCCTYIVNLSIKQYAEQKGIHTDVQKFYSYYSERGWKTKNGQSITNWKGTLVYWGKTDGTCQGKRKPETYVLENAAAYESLIYNLQENDDSDKA